MNQQLIQAIEACRECAITCKACAAALKEESGSEQCIDICLECAMICELCVSLGESNSELFNNSLELGMLACNRCAEHCERHTGDACMKCSWQCRKTLLELSNVTA